MADQDKLKLIHLISYFKILFNPSGKAESLQYWREHIVSTMYAIFVVFGFIAYVPSVYLAIANQIWVLAIVDTIAYASIVFIHLSNRFSFKFRVYFILFMFYLISFSLLFNVDASYSIMWFFSIPIIASILLNMKASIVALVGNVLMLALTAALISNNIVAWGPAEIGRLEGWFILSVNFMFLNIVVAFTAAILVEKMVLTIEQTEKVNKELDTEKKKLELEIEHRINAETEKEAIAKKLDQSQKMEAVGLMAGGVAHDLNNILSGIINYPELLLRKLPQDSELRKPLNAILNSGNRAAEVVSDLLTVARGVASTKKSHNLNTIINEYLESAEAKKLCSLYPGIHINTELDQKIQNILCSYTHVFKSLMNLIINSAESIATEGIITICSRTETIKNDSKIPSLVIGTYTVLEVIDSGKGISENDLDRIFEPFYTKKVMGRSGTGLGLAIVWNTVHEHNGHVTVSCDDSSTRFSLYFPVTEISDEEPAEQQSIEQQMGHGETILVVDDDATQRDIASEMLMLLNYRVTSVSSGEAAVKYLQNNEANLLLLDMIMAPGMSGLDTYLEIVKFKPDQKAVIVSGFSENKDVKDAQKSGAGEFISKPYTQEKISAAIKKCLSE